MSSPQHSQEFPAHLGPKGLGNPDDRSLRKVEKDILIPKMMKEEVKIFCSEETKGFTECSKRQGLLMPFRCRGERDIMNQCTIKWYTNEEYIKQTTEKYLSERSQYRRTGIPSRVFKRQ